MLKGIGLELPIGCGGLQGRYAGVMVRLSRAKNKNVQFVCATDQSMRPSNKVKATGVRSMRVPIRLLNAGLYFEPCLCVDELVSSYQSFVHEFRFYLDSALDSFFVTVGEADGIASILVAGFPVEALAVIPSTYSQFPVCKAETKVVKAIGPPPEQSDAKLLYQNRRTDFFTCGPGVHVQNKGGATALPPLTVLIHLPLPRLCSITRIDQLRETSRYPERALCPAIKSR